MPADRRREQRGKSPHLVVPVHEIPIDRGDAGFQDLGHAFSWKFFWHQRTSAHGSTMLAASASVLTGQSTVRLISHEALELPPRPAKHVEIDRTVDPGTCAGVVILPDHPLARSERGLPKQAPQPEPLAC